MTELGTGPQLDIWRLEGEIERCTDPAQREALQRQRLEAQRELVADPPLVPAGGCMPVLPGLDFAAELQAFGRLTPAEKRARAAEEVRSHEEERRRRLREAAAKREEARRELLSSIPGRLRALALDPSGLKRTAAVAAVRGLRSGMCILSGTHDAGKSQAAAAALAPAGLWVPAPRFLDEWMKRRDELVRVRRLVIDEVGREGGTREQRLLAAEALVHLAHLRSEEADRLTIWTTNCDREGLRVVLTVSRGAAPASERWTLLKERLRAHGRTAATTAEIEELGGRVPWPGFVECPHEGFRRQQR